ncbi:hypothetical protein [Pyrobaculum neutrophilum]|uniref:Uncharacterized protein n=1 Tax=Pyrobaculum neutrophilum (strain DSM 2338 / JCM 9278 / NBRC 100436 / V24Sta) TaxID=444157 RepID=B1YC97_PYRNV|nr:hypothetical protein [Pyrobaculum neutrophilum]ACB39410.1 conserved hypothetical protein [Pyrobaculum neutrophilum V24Sta]
MIVLALLGGLAVGGRWGAAYGVLAAYLLYVLYGFSPPLGAAAALAAVAAARGLKLDRLALYALAAAFGKFLLLPYLAGRPIPYYEALWYAAQISPVWRTYAPLTYLPHMPPLELAVEGTLFAVGVAALASRALAEAWGRGAVLWPLLAPEPLVFGHFAMAMPLAWTAAYFAQQRRWGLALLSAALAAGFHIYGGAVALLFVALYGAPWSLLLAPLALLAPQSWVLTSLLWRIPGTDLLSVVEKLAFRAEWFWYIKLALELAVVLSAAVSAGRAGVVPLAGVLGALLTARAPEEYAGFVYRHFAAVLPFARLRPLWAFALLAAVPYLIQVYFFGLDWGWALRYARSFACGCPLEGPVESAYRLIYLKG